MVVSTTHAQTPALEGSTPRPRKKPLSEGAALLMRPVSEGGAGFGNRKTAERVGGARSLLELQHWILEARRLRVDSIGAFVNSSISNGDAPPESFLRAEKELHNAPPTGFAAELVGLSDRMSVPRVDARLTNDPPPGDEEDDETEEPRRRSAPRQDPDRPNCMAYQRLR